MKFLLLGALMTIAQPLTVPAAPKWVQSGKITWYDCTRHPRTCSRPRADGRHYTRSGQPFDPQAMTIAHPWLPMGSRVLIVTSKGSVEAIVNDRGPYCANQLGGLRRGFGYQAILDMPCNLAADVTPAVAARILPNWGDTAFGAPYGDTVGELYLISPP